MRFGYILTCLGILLSACATTPATISESAVVQSTASEAAIPYRVPFDPRAWHNSIAGPPTKVATLGSTHLSQRNGVFDNTTLEPLLAKLMIYNPTIITHEGLSGEQCEVVQRHAKIYPEIFQDYCRSVDEGFKATGLSLPQARAEAETLLKTWPASPSASQRRRLAALFIASGDRPSAQVQWLQLAPSERVVGDGVDAAVLTILTRAGAKPNESYEIGVVLAARLGLQRVYAVDDHTADSIQAAAPEGYGAALQAHWSTATNDLDPTFRARMTAIDADLTTGPKLLDAFRFYNEPETQIAFIKIDYERSLGAQSPQLLGRRYVAWWETRNLRMVANIRSAFGNSPGARVLNIVGSSHKPYYDAYLGMMSEVELVDMGEILK